MDRRISAERLARIKNALRRYRRFHTFTQFVSDDEAVELIDLAATAMLDRLADERH
jgi:hypothetical protein